jgi:hypothetical protein
LQPGSATVKLTNSPADHLCDVELFDSAGTSVGEAYVTDVGADCTVNATALVGGDYTIDAHTFSGPPASAGEGAAPATVTGSYTLTVTQ